jgi:ParB-like chromosome segregation protein Spo0J
MKPKIEYISTEKLIPYVNNARVHSDEQVLQIAGSIKEFGFNNPVLVDKGCGIIAGHGRVMAAKRLDITEVPCIRLEHLTEAQRKAYILADNKIAENSSWDRDLLTLEIDNLKALDFDVDLLGFDESEFVNVDDTTRPKDAPDDFAEYDDDLSTDFKCPKCNYEWSGKPK